MEIRELRIGNYVDWNGETGIVSQLLEKDICFKCGEECLYEDLKPLPLTEEWLLKFGFYAKHHHDNFSFNGFEISSSQRRIDTNERSVFYLMLTEDSKFNIRIEHVHKLQNLYFALTGEELIINN